MSSFENDLKFEQENQERYDRFYKGFCGFSMIIRTDYSTEAGRKLQEMDIDAVVLSDEGDVYTISEKHRRNNYNDLLIEIYSSYCSFSPGWIETSKARNLVIFTDDILVPEVIVVDMKNLQSFLSKYRIIEQVKEDCSNFYFSRKSSERKIINIEGRPVKCRLVRSENKGYATISLAIPWSSIQAEYKVYDWNGKRKD